MSLRKKVRLSPQSNDNDDTQEKKVEATEEAKEDKRENDNNDNNEDEENVITTWFAISEVKFFPSKKDCKDNIRKRFDFTESCDTLSEIKKTTKIFAAWEIPAVGHIYYVSHYDPENDFFYGFVNLGFAENAEWGVISYDELRDIYNKPCQNIMKMFPLIHTFKNGPVCLKDIPYNAKLMMDKAMIKN